MCWSAELQLNVEYFTSATAQREKEICPCFIFHQEGAWGWGGGFWLDIRPHTGCRQHFIRLEHFKTGEVGGS